MQFSDLISSTRDENSGSIAIKRLLGRSQLAGQVTFSDLFTCAHNIFAFLVSCRGTKQLITGLVSD